MPTPTTKRAGRRANWWGLLDERVNRTFGRVFDDEALSGILGSETNHFGVPYSLTEEFVAVYRMHPLIPDEWSFRAHEDDTVLERRRFRELTGAQAAAVAGRLSLGDLYAFRRLLHLKPASAFRVFILMASRRLNSDRFFSRDYTPRV
jgi:hypothetical protein